VELCKFCLTIERLLSSPPRSLRLTDFHIVFQRALKTICLKDIWLVYRSLLADSLLRTISIMTTNHIICRPNPDHKPSHNPSNPYTNAKPYFPHISKTNIHYCKFQPEVNNSVNDVKFQECRAKTSCVRIAPIGRCVR